MNISIFRGTSKIYALPLICLIGVLLLLGVMPQAAYASPGIPNQFYGTLTINGKTAASGYTVTAKDNGVDSGASTTTDSQGRYGYSAALIVPGNQGDSITFFVNGVQAGQTATFQPGAITNLPLTVSGTVSASGITTQTTTTTTTTTTPAYTPPVEQTPAYTPPVEQTPAYTPPTETTPTYTQPTSTSPTSLPASQGSTTQSPSTAQTSASTGSPSFADYSFSELTVAPQVANAGDQITATVRVDNSGNGSDSKNVVLKVNDVNMAQQVVQVDPGKSQYINFTFTENTPGTYSVIVEGQTATLQVQAAPAQAAGGSSSIPVMVIIAAGVLLAIVLVVILIMRQRRDQY